MRIKIHQWIEKHNQEVCAQIASQYFLESGSNITYALHRSFYKLYLKRLWLIFLSIISFRLPAYKRLSDIIAGRSFSIFASYDYSVSYSRVKEFLWHLFGHGYFSPSLLPLLPEDKIVGQQLAFGLLHERPIVSIIIPVYNHLSFTYNCLLSLSKHLPVNYSSEIIIIDDCSTDQTPRFLKAQNSYIRYIRNKRNIGFLHSCNKAASVARGRYLCFLNNDTQIQPGWLENLILALEADNDNGCVGSKLIFPCGLLQEAGGIVYSDGTTGRFGSLEPPKLLQFDQLKNVDYCSGASLMIRRSDFEKINQFDERFAPAYYEDTDLCMSCRHVLGKNVIYQPASQVIHFEKVSSNDQRVDTLLATNRGRFFDKWIKELKLQPNAS